MALALFEKYKQVNMSNLRLTDEETTAIVKFLKDPTVKPAAPEDKPRGEKMEHGATHQ